MLYINSTNEIYNWNEQMKCTNEMYIQCTDVQCTS